MSIAFAPDTPANAAILSLKAHRSTMDRDETHQSLLDHVLDFATRAEQTIMEQSARIAELESMARTDELTGLTNRRGLESALEGILASATRHNEVGVICYIDIDDFKSVNDTYGHATGDDALKLVADTVSDNLRTEDISARVGGDEFVVIMKGASVHDGLQKARLLQDKLGDIRLDAGDEEIEIRVSMGIQAYDGETQLTEILHRADCAMYAQKRAKKAPLVAINPTATAH